MNKAKLIAACLLAILTTSAFAETPIERELAELTAQRDKAAAATTEPIQRRYREVLEQLLRRTTQSGDLDGALKIRAQIQQLTGAPLPAGQATATPVAPAAPPTVPAPAMTSAAPTALSGLKRELNGSSWTYTNKQDDTKGPVRVVFQKDAVAIDKKPYPWQAVDADTIAIENIGTMTFDKNRKTYILDRKEGLRYGERL